MSPFCLLLVVLASASAQRKPSRGCSSFEDCYDEVTKPPQKGFGAIQKCGEGSDEGVHRCVKYHECDPADNMANELDDQPPGQRVVNLRGGSNTCEHIHYLDVCCRVTGGQPTTPRPATSTTRRPPTKPRGCGVRNANGVDFRITGGTDGEAQYGEFPWVVALLRRGAQERDRFAFCGGSLITPQVVLTAAHCVFNLSASDVTVRAGEWDARTDKERLPYQERDVVGVTLHEGFDRAVLYNDVALLILDSSVELDEHIGTVCLPSQGQRVQSDNCFASGWGKNVFEGQYQMILKKVELPMVDASRCLSQLRKTRLGRRFILHDSFTCAGGEEGKDTCKGDGGGALACPTSDSGAERYVQTGIVSWGISCGEKDVPGVYADVSKFRDWIDAQLDSRGLERTSYSP